MTETQRKPEMAVELPENPPLEIDAMASVETGSGRGTAFVIRNDGTHADLVTNEHVIGTASSARASIDRGSSGRPARFPFRRSGSAGSFCATAPPSCGRRGGCRAATPVDRCSSGSTAGCASPR
jgi:hypothetical protein